MGHYGMLQCAANFKMGYGGKNCEKCGVIDDEDHRINYCSKWGRNLSKSTEKVDFQDIYSDDRCKSLKVVEKVLSLWDLGNGKNAMRTDPW